MSSYQTITLSFSNPPALDLKRAVFTLGIVSRCFLLVADSEGEKEVYKLIFTKLSYQNLSHIHMYMFIHWFGMF